MNLTNHLLLPMPTMAGDYFSDTLILLCEHNDDGAMGLIVNQPTDVTVYELFSELGIPTHADLLQQSVYEGGPVDPQRGFILHSDDVDYPESHPLIPGVRLTTTLDSLVSIGHGNGPAKYQVALGYAGWGAGQLEDEISNNIWLTMEADADLLFEGAADQRLHHAAARLGINLSLVANPGHA